MVETAETSLYLAEAGPEAPLPPFRGTARAQVAIIGGGITGLSCALHLAEAGVDVTLLEAYGPGWGASGRNGGQLNPGLKPDPSEILETFGAARGGALVRLAWGAVDETAALIARLGIDCQLVRNGTIRAAQTPADVAAVRKSQQDMAARGMPVDWLEADAIARLVGHRHYAGGFIDRRGGQVQPLRYVRGLARASAAAGAVLHGNSRVTGIAPVAGGWSLQVNDGTLQARQVLVATNGYADGLVPGLARAMVPVFSSILSTPPLPEGLAEAVMPGRQSLYESGLVTVYARVDAGGRLIIGGRGPMAPSSRVADIGAVARHALRLWPGLARVGWERAWNGRVAITPDHLPHLHQIGPGFLALYGYNGRGVALAGALGRVMAAHLAGAIPLEDVPVPVTPLQPIRFHRFWKVGVQATIGMARARAALARARG